MARALAALLLGLASLAVAPRASAGAVDPVLLVHGYRGSPATWADMVAYLRAHERTVFAIDLPGEDNIANAKAIRDKLRALDWTKVDIVGQSMGGLSARWFAKFIAGSNTVDAYVSLGTPQRGLWRTCVLPSWYGGQMCPARAFLRELNAGDDTPGTAYWTTISGTDDGYVSVDAARLDGGACFVSVDGVGHNAMDNDPGVMASTLAAIDHRCTGTYRSS
jgi:pimeloyl-ACP methyl ester carboxylesterase